MSNNPIMKPRCGTCSFAEIFNPDISQRTCFGVPPTPLPQMTPGPRGGGQVTVRMAQPIVHVTHRACALYRPKELEDTARDAEAMLAMHQLAEQRKPQ